MFILKHYLGNKFKRMNEIIDSFNDMESNYINLEACCSYPFESVLEAQKAPIYLLPTEGTIGNRYFPNMDSIEQIDIYAEELLLNLFNIQNIGYCATTQPHSGTQANQIVYNAILNDGDTIISLDSKSGGHISHNKFVKNICIKNYGLTDKNEINYEEIDYLVKKHKPKLVIIGASSFANSIDYQQIIKISHSHNSLVLVDICHTVLYILGRQYPTPLPGADFVTFTMDKTLRGPQGGILIYKKEFSKKINYSIFPKTQGGPLQSLQFAKLACLVELNNINLSEYAKDVQNNTKIMNNYFVDKGVSTYSNDNSTHIILINTKQFGLTGFEAESLLFKNHILANKNIVPCDSELPNITSGIRFGTTFITNQSYKRNDVENLSEYILKILMHKKVDEYYMNFIKKYNINSAN